MNMARLKYSYSYISDVHIIDKVVNSIGFFYLSIFGTYCVAATFLDDR